MFPRDMDRPDLDALLSDVIPTTPTGADLVLDLRELLLSGGHPGKCVRCFFGLLGHLDQPGALAPLRHWLENHIVVSLAASGKTMETLPVDLGAGGDIREFCERTIRTVREDRAYTDPRIELRFQYRHLAAAN